MAEWPVTAFYDLMFNQCRPAEAIEKYAGNVYIQNNPMVADGKQAVNDPELNRLYSICTDLT